MLVPLVDPGCALARRRASRGAAHAGESAVTLDVHEDPRSQRAATWASTWRRSSRVDRRGRRCSQRNCDRLDRSIFALRVFVRRLPSRGPHLANWLGSGRAAGALTSSMAGWSNAPSHWFARVDQKDVVDQPFRGVALGARGLNRTPWLEGKRVDLRWYAMSIVRRHGDRHRHRALRMILGHSGIAGNCSGTSLTETSFIQAKRRRSKSHKVLRLVLFGGDDRRNSAAGIFTPETVNLAYVCESAPGGHKERPRKQHGALRRPTDHQAELKYGIAQTES